MSIYAEFSMDESRRMVEVHVKGHAGASIKANDLVCASASMLDYTLAQNCKMEEAQGLYKYKPEIKLKSGNSKIRVRCKDDESYSQTLHTFLVIQTGYQLLAHNYPGFVFVKMFGEEHYEDIVNS